ncbi:hypothetical protein [Phormidium sp. CCY1219]|uniref:hypothetical protein n=1 Tax=Phormidium sp. CCY1219 TaxID=2886104 RepID=UPI002D1F3550|nr:hypothetical protein [Phormidium sp. CCY1219]MEB3829083.1 hypothetical protein [Phormidium sp. CCY1219]
MALLVLGWCHQGESGKIGDRGQFGEMQRSGHGRQNLLCNYFYLAIESKRFLRLGTNRHNLIGNKSDEYPNRQPSLLVYFFHSY